VVTRHNTVTTVLSCTHSLPIEYVEYIEYSSKYSKYSQYSESREDSKASTVNSDYSKNITYSLLGTHSLLRCDITHVFALLPCEIMHETPLFIYQPSLTHSAVLNTAHVPEPHTV
jgi:hypothetical protein